MQMLLNEYAERTHFRIHISSCKCVRNYVYYFQISKVVRVCTYSLYIFKI